MSIPSRTQVERSSTSAERLRLALADLVIEQGYISTTAAEIGVRAGYSRAMVRERYGSKDALLIALQREYEELLVGDSTGLEGATGLDSLLAGFDRLLSFARDHPRLLRAILIVSLEGAAGNHLMRPEVRRWLELLVGQFELWLTAGQNDGSIRADLDASAESEQLVVEAIGHAYRWIQTDIAVGFTDRIESWRNRVVRHLASGRRRGEGRTQPVEN
ncbi:TetR/AcrR family transcriptional regulator [Antrihabitans sp. YC2-6]|uniref:TetR/AcrR family transcriptional regulator n=1 Tax=Antrihabitans sp. YC2-6 TaxID=2799498 RepID=UPI0018F2C0A8|nr:TetR/AcrR family transcriptional regulator [Antrihabitans sp. YC2-6]MBJ8344374.1 TetR/AcrR family transcriptional regulator [Antrihabitans sp. YC2-6]